MMKSVAIISLAFGALSAYAAMGSSVSVPVQEHMKYTFGNHREHPVQQLEEDRYLHSLAPMDAQKVRISLEKNGYSVETIKLRDIRSELVYEADVTDAKNSRIRVYADPATGAVLKKDGI